jgi:hypothetical protein
MLDHNSSMKEAMVVVVVVVIRGVEREGEK